ncbi:hypothetical protein SBV1_1170015 [Verrucomicrobia bacterium]|nr:hypothetical protein SBV1_1170015 [Verrucomicrobiota bacterium]
MSKTFVALSDPVHNLIRNVTRHTLLQLCITPGQLPAMQYRVRPQDLPEAYYSLAVFHAIEGRSLDGTRLPSGLVTPAEKNVVPELVNFFDAVKLDRRCSRDLRLKLKKKGPGMLSCELLSFGTGMLCARNDDPEDLFQRHLWRQHGSLHSTHAVVFARIRALHCAAVPNGLETRKESYDSSNIIYGDCFGELEQLWDRRADTVFLEQVAHSLQGMRRHAEVAAYLHPPLNLQGIIKFHLRAQALWAQPPPTARILLRRLEFIFEHTKIDYSPQTVFRRNSAARAPAARPPRPNRPWHADRSGYDGWLSSGS